MVVAVMMKLSEVCNRYADRSEALLREFQIEHFNAGGEASERCAHIRVEAIKIATLRMAAVKHAEREASNNIIDLTRYRVPMPEGIEW